MSITFDQWIDIILDNALYEEGFKIQNNVHSAAAVLHEWKLDNLTNQEAATILNADLGDSEWTTVKTYLNALSNVDSLAVEMAMRLARDGIDGYDKTALRARFGV